MSTRREKQPRARHVPERTCVACRQPQPKRGLVRLVRVPEGGVYVDDTGKRAGRGAYLCRDRACWDVALTRGHLHRALKTELQADDLARLRQYAEAIPHRVGTPGIPDSAVGDHDAESLADPE